MKKLFLFNKKYGVLRPNFFISPFYPSLHYLTFKKLVQQNLPYSAESSINIITVERKIPTFTNTFEGG